MSEVINGVPRELLEEIDRCLRVDRHYTTSDKLRALLTEQTQASAAQSAQYRVTFYYLATGMEGRADERDYGVVDANSEEEAIEKTIARHFQDCSVSDKSFIRGCLKATREQAAQSAPAGEREDVREAAKAYRKGADVASVESGFVAGAAWQRAKSAPVVPVGWETIFIYADQLAGMVLKGDTPHTIQRTAAALRAMLAAAPAQPAAHDQGEVQRLREALENAKAFFDNPIARRKLSGVMIDEARQNIRAALAASTGQEV